MTRLTPLFGAVAVVRGANQRGWRHVDLQSCALGVLWSAPAATLTIATLVAGLRSSPSARSLLFANFEATILVRRADLVVAELVRPPVNTETDVAPAAGQDASPD